MTFEDALFPCPALQDFLRGLLHSDPAARLSFAAIHSHPFFQSVAWAAVGTTTPRFIPALTSPDDHSRFDPMAVASTVRLPTLSRAAPTKFEGTQLPFAGFSYSGVVLSMTVAPAPAGPTGADSLAESLFTAQSEVRRLNSEKKDMQARLAAAQELGEEHWAALKRCELQVQAAERRALELQHSNE